MSRHTLKFYQHTILLALLVLLSGIFFAGVLAVLYQEDAARREAEAVSSGDDEAVNPEGRVP